MRLLKGQVQFQLPKPTKTYTPKTASKTSHLQFLTIKEFPGNQLLCPLTTLNSYIKRTKYRRGHVDNLFVLVTVQEPRQAAQGTIVRWAKNVMKNAGLENYSIHSTRGASSTSAFLMGMPIDAIVSRVGWLHASTFVKHYLKPLGQVSLKSVSASEPSQAAAAHAAGAPGQLPDPHGFAPAIGNVTPKLPFARTWLPFHSS